MALSRVFRSSETLFTVRTVPIAVAEAVGPPVVSRKKTPLHSPKLSSRLPATRHSAATAFVCGFSTPMQARFHHTDVTSVPTFDQYRIESSQKSTSEISSTAMPGKLFSYAVLFASAAALTTGAKHAVRTFVLPLGPSEKTLAESSAEVSLSAIPEGKNLVIKWRNKPLFIRHRTAEEISRERSVPLSELRDPQRDEDRVKEDRWLVCLGVCTHLGCVPIAHAGDFPGGYYCPCHGSHYDASGRIRKGPAPTNLEVPEYVFKDESTLLVG